GKSITHLEYEEAGRRDIPRLIFLLHDDAPWPQKRVDRDRQRIRELRQHLLAEHNLRFFRNASELAAELIAALSRLVGAGTPIPELLPYLSDRSEQERAIEEALDKVDPEEPTRPLVALVHGDERQCHDKFLDRLKEMSVPRLLGLAGERTVESVFLPWPRSFRDRAELRGYLLKELAERVVGRRTATAEEINERLHPGPVVVHTHLLTRDWRGHGLGTLHGFPDLWQSWPELASPQRLLAFLFFKYELETADRGFFPRTLRRLRRTD
ncbi:MAG: hypothetical protein GY856_05345, partial [bacterium]|nr:hypothetical protein [bacterium]